MAASIAAQVATQTAILERLEQQFKEDRQERKAAQDETEFTRKSVSAELTALRHGQDSALARLDKIEPVTDLVTSLGAKATGAIMLLGFLGAIAWGGIVFFKDIILGWFQ